MDRNELKIQALLQRLAEEESRAADYRVDVTLLSNELESVREELKAYKDAETDKTVPENPVVAGTVVSDD